MIAMTDVFTIIGVQVGGNSYPLDADSLSSITRKKKTGKLKFRVKYVTEVKKGFLFSSKKITDVVKGEYSIDEYEIITQDIESERSVKKMGVGVVAGAVLAGPVGAVAGGVMGAGKKPIPAMIKLNDSDIILQIMMPVKLIEELQKKAFFNQRVQS